MSTCTMVLHLRQCCIFPACVAGAFRQRHVAVIILVALIVVFVVAGFVCYLPSTKFDVQLMFVYYLLYRITFQYFKKIIFCFVVQKL